MTTAPKSGATARLEPMAGLERLLARCGVCGQALWIIEGGCLMEQLAWGWTYDEPTHTWSANETYLAKRHAAKERLRAGCPLPGDREALRAAHGFAGRLGLPPRSSWLSTREGRAALRLPQNVICDNCGAANGLTRAT